MKITRANRIKEYQYWGDLYTVEFDLTVKAIPPPTSSKSIIRFTEGTEVDRIPALFLTGKGEIMFANSKLGPYYFGIEVGKTYQMTIQHFKECKKYWYEIIVDGISKFKIENTSPEIFSNVKFFAGDPWHEPFSSDYGSICNVRIGKLKYVICLSVLLESLLG